MTFVCEMKNTDNEIEKWTGKIKKIINYGSHYELFIESRSSIMILFGRSSSGGFIAIPDFQAGCHLVELNDIFWNSKKLSTVSGKVDGITVATVLYNLFQKCIL